MMRFKIDESLHSDAADLLRREGHDALTVFEQGLQGEADTEIAALCRQEGGGGSGLKIEDGGLSTDRWSLTAVRPGVADKWGAERWCGGAGGKEGWVERWRRGW